MISSQSNGVPSSTFRIYAETWRIGSLVRFSMEYFSESEVWWGSAIIRSHEMLSNPAETASFTAFTARSESCSLPRNLSSASFMDCTPTERRFMPILRRLHCLSKLSEDGFASRVISAFGHSENEFPISLIISPICSAVSREGVPPPK